MIQKTTSCQPEILNSKTGPFTLRHKGKLIHSLYDPIKEAQTITRDLEVSRGETLIVFGLGLGYHVFELAKKIEEDTQVIVIESERTIYKKAREYMNFKHRLKDKNVSFIINEPLDSTLHVIESLNPKRIKLFKHPILYELGKSYFDSLEKEILNLQERKQIIEKIKETHKVSFYIPSYNAERTISRCIESVMGQTYPIEEILVIIDGSTDRTPNIASQYPVKIITHPTRKGLPASRNTGFQNATAPFVATIAADDLAEPSWLENLMYNFYCNEGVVGVGGRLIERILTIADQFRADFMKQHQGNIRNTNAEALTGNNNVFKKEAVIEIGGYDERRTAAAEDMDLCKRLRNKGYRFIYEPRAVVSHLQTDTPLSIIRHFWFWQVDRSYEQGMYDGLDKVKKKIERNFYEAGINYINYHLDQRKSHLLYVDFLMPLVWSALDLWNLWYPQGISKKVQTHRPWLLKHLLLLLCHVTLSGLKAHLFPNALIRKVETDLSKLIKEIGHQDDTDQNGKTDFGKKIEEFEALFFKSLDHYFKESMKVANMIKASCLMDPPPFSRTQKMKEAKILLVRPPHRESKKNKEGGPHPIPFPFSLAYACSMLERNKKACYIIDAIAEGILWEEFLRRCIWLEPDILVIEGSVIHIMDIMNAAKAIKGEINGRLKIILCGLSPTQTKDPFLIDDSLDGDGSFDFLLVGEYESTLLSLIECLERDECVEKVPGIIFRNEKKITANQKKPSLQNLDKLPWPHRRFLPMYNYQSSIAELPMPNGQIQISRHTEDPTPKDSVIRVRNPIDVAAEMEYLAKEYGFKGLHLVGPVPKTDWIRRLSMEIDKRGIKIPWVPREYEVVL